MKHLYKINMHVSATIFFLLLFTPMEPARAAVSGVNVNIVPTQTIVVDSRHRIIRVISNSHVQGRLVVLRNRPEDYRLDMNHDIQHQYDRIIDSIGSLFPGLVYEKERSWIEIIVDYIISFVRA